MRKYSHEIPDFSGKKVTIAGWIDNLRDLGKIRFFTLRDREGIAQVTLKVDNKLFDEFKKLTKEDVVLVTGRAQKMEIAPMGVEIIPDQIKILSKASAPLPLDISGKIKSDLDTRLSARFMDLRRPEIKAIFMIRNCILTAVREHLEENGFIEIHTPKIVATGAEGGASLFPITYFEREAFLAQSPQLFKQIMMSTGFDRVYEIAPAYRAEESDTIRHVSEFTSFDMEMAFIESQEDVLDLLEKTVIYSLKHAKKHAADYFEMLNIDLKIPKKLPRLKYVDVLKMLEKEGKKITAGEDINTESEKILGKIMEKKGHELYYITDYPSKIKPFYIMADGDFSRSFDLDYKGQEIASGGQREHRYDVLVSRMKKQNLNPKSFEFYLRAFKYGMPPHGGFGFGVDRFIQQMLSLFNIREAILFPRDRRRLVP